MKIQFDNSLTYQQDAIDTLVGVFKGQEICNSNFTVYSPLFIEKYSLLNEELSANNLGYANKLRITEGQLLENIQRTQLKNGLKPSTREEIDVKHIDLSLEMETGTGKTYVYLRSIMDLHDKHGFSKFIIVVPSIAIKEGVYKSLEITETHLKEHYNNINYKYFVYNSSDLNAIRDFATSSQLQIMVINIQAFAKDTDDEKSNTNRILLNYNDRIGYKPITLIQDTRPIVIVDEPQKVLNSALGKKSIANLKPLAVVRYSATHREKINLLYKLDAVDAYSKQLVKQIEVASIKVEGEAKPEAYLKLISVSNKSGIAAKLELDIRGKDGKVKRSKKDVKQGADLLQLTKLDAYSNLMVRHIYTDESNQYIEFTNDKELKVGETFGAIDDSLIKRLQIRKTIEEHLDKELVLNPKGIKVLSLFFIDKVSNYRVYDENGNEGNGKYAQIFEEEYKAIIKKSRYRTLFNEIVDLEQEVQDVHKGYFSIDKKPKANNIKEKYEFFKDSTEKSNDESTYNLIMKDKETLLSFGTEKKHKIRFIFSHTALREGWDNPNVFQICTLKDSSGTEISRRQEIGRGLRLCVNQQGERVYGFDTNTLTVMASESYEDFVKNLQKEIEEDTGIRFGHIQTHSFSGITVELDGNEPVFFGQAESEKLYAHLVMHNYIDAKGNIRDKLKTDLIANTVALPDNIEPHVQSQIVNTLKQLTGKLDIKRSEEKQKIKVKEAVLLSTEFKELWERIKFKTTYSVNFKASELIEACIKNINNRLVISKGRITYTTNIIDVSKGGVSFVNEGEVTYDTIHQEIAVLPDIVSYLQNETKLTRKSIVEILTNCINLNYFKINPQKYIEGCIDIINEQMRLHIVDGIVYNKIGEHEYYSQELFQNEELIGYLKSNMQASTKSPFEYVVYDSNIESDLAKQFERDSHVKVYVKLPSWFTIDTPLGNYNPDWAVLFENNNEEKIYFVVESKGTMGLEFLRPAEIGKIECGKRHFENLSKTSNKQVSMLHVSKYDDFIAAALS